MDILFILLLAIFLGFELIAKVPAKLHTPLMSGSNAVSGITVIGALSALSHQHHTLGIILAVSAVTLAMINVVGGYAVTQRMLNLFKP